MATFTIDLLTGKVFLFNKDFTGSGSTGGGGSSGSTYSEVNTFNELPSAGANNGIIYVVRESTGAYVLNRKSAGLYYSNGTIWRRLGDIPSFFSSDNFQVYESSDTGGTTGIQLVTSGITQGNFRKIQVQDSDGTIAYLTDLNSKVDTSAFADYTGNTAPNTFISKDTFTGYTATTSVRLMGIENAIAGKQNQLKPTQITGGTIPIEVNTVVPTEISWGNSTFISSDINYSGGSRIYILEDGRYEISYTLNNNNNSTSRKTIGTVIRKNGNVDVSPMSVASYLQDTSLNRSSNVMTDYNINLLNGDYIELVAFRIGNSGSVTTIPEASWIKAEKIE
jgi:hypothetical protein